MFSQIQYHASGCFSKSGFFNGDLPQALDAINPFAVLREQVVFVQRRMAKNAPCNASSPRPKEECPSVVPRNTRASSFLKVILALHWPTSWSIIGIAQHQLLMFFSRTDLFRKRRGVWCAKSRISILFYPSLCKIIKQLDANVLRLRYRSLSMFGKPHIERKKSLRYC